jgi:polysaccharide biosynthesis/export protein PslD
MPHVMASLRSLLRDAPAFLALLALLAGCETPRSHELTIGSDTPVYFDDLTQAERDAASNAIADGLRRGTGAYRLQPGDRVEVMYNTDNRRLRPYRIGIRDELEIDFQFDRELNRQVVVRPDGMISLPAKGEISAIGVRPTDLATRIAERYRDVARDPVITVSVRKFFTPADDLADVVQSAADGRARQAVVRPDGLIDLPMAQGVRAAGLTPEDLRDELDHKYATAVGGVRTTVRLMAIAANQIFIFGEVKQPGAIPAPVPRTLLQTVAAAGGPTPSGAMDQVRVLYFDPLGRARVRQVNLERVLTELRMSEDMLVPPNSTVFVPPTQLAKAGRFVDQVFRQIFLYNGISIAIDPFLSPRGLSAR